MWKAIGYGVMGLLLITALSWYGTGNDFFMYKFFAPKQEAVRRQVFEETKSYNQGVIQELRSAQIEYVRAPPEQKEALRTVLVHRYADYPEYKLPADLRGFLSDLRGSL